MSQGDFFLFFKKASNKLKGSDQLLIYFGRSRLGQTIKTNFIAFQTADREIYFDFLKKDLELVSLPHLVYNCSRKIFVMSYSIT